MGGWNAGSDTLCREPHTIHRVTEQGFQTSGTHPVPTEPMENPQPFMSAQPAAALAATLSPPPAASQSTEKDSSLQSFLAADMQAVDTVIAQRLHSSVPLVGQVAQYIIQAGGKRLRPALLLLTSGALGCDRQHPGYAHRHLLAAVVEFIHTATLLHDDVVDESSMRRGRATANRHFGNPASVLVGDFLYSRAFQMMVATDSMQVMRILSDATNVIAEGEVLQLMHVQNASLDRNTYIEVIRSKTAKLFEASARLGAVVSGAGDRMEQAAADYGQSMGTAFQIVDDMLDYQGDAQVLGKNLGDDLREGKVTLPLILAMQRARADDAQLIRACIHEPQAHADSFGRVIDIVRSTDALDATLEAAAQQAATAAEAARLLPDNRYSQHLNRLATDLLKRQQ